MLITPGVIASTAERYLAPDPPGLLAVPVADIAPSLNHQLVLLGCQQAGQVLLVTHAQIIPSAEIGPDIKKSKQNIIQNPINQVY